MDKNVRTKLFELIQLLQESPAYVEFSQAKEELANNPLAQNLLQSYTLSANALQRASIAGQEGTEAEKILFASLSEKIFEQDETAKYISNELLLKSTIAEIIQILSKELHLDY